MKEKPTYIPRPEEHQRHDILVDKKARVIIEIKGRKSLVDVCRKTGSSNQSMVFMLGCCSICINFLLGVLLYKYFSFMHLIALVISANSVNEHFLEQLVERKKRKIY